MSMTLLQSSELHPSPRESHSQKELHGDMTEALPSTTVPGKKAHRCSSKIQASVTSTKVTA